MIFSCGGGGGGDDDDEDDDVKGKFYPKMISWMSKEPRPSTRISLLVVRDHLSTNYRSSWAAETAACRVRALGASWNGSCLGLSPPPSLRPKLRTEHVAAVTHAAVRKRHKKEKGEGQDSSLHSRCPAALAAAATTTTTPEGCEAPWRRLLLLPSQHSPPGGSSSTTLRVRVRPRQRPAT